MSRQYSPPEKPSWKDPVTISDWTILLIALVAIVISIFDIFNIWNIPWFTQRVPVITVVLLSLFILSSVIERHFLIKQGQDSLIREIRNSQIGPYRGLTSVYARRDRLLPFPELVQDATEEILIVGINFGYISLNQTRTLAEKAASGCKIRLLVVDPGTDDFPNPLLEPLQETFGTSLIGDQLKTDLHHLTDWRSKLSTSISRRIEIRTTRSLDFCTLKSES